MNARFRLLHFAPDPFNGIRWPLGAIVQSDEGLLVARSTHLPGPECLGGEKTAVLAHRLHARLNQVSCFERAPQSFGPYVLLGDPRPVPNGVMDPVSWLQNNLLPRLGDAGKGRKGVRAADRKTLGYNFFRTYQVSSWVRQSFDPDHDWGARLPSKAHGLEKVSHWAGGRDELLLMEPVVPARRQLDADLRKLATQALAYRSVLDDSEFHGRAHVIAYVLTGGDDGQRGAAMDVLGGKVHWVVDTCNLAERDMLLKRIRQVGQAADPQASFHA